MNRPYSYSHSTSRRTGAGGPVETEVIEDYDEYDPADDYYGHDRHDEDRDDDDYDEVYTYTEPIDRRWVWVAGVAGAVLLVAVLCTVVILGGGDSGSVTATYPPAPSIATSTPAPTKAPSRTPSMPAPVPLTPETVTTVSPVPTAEVPPTTAVAPPAPRTVTYQVTGTRQLIDLITVIYTDGQGALQTDVNVALPWTKSVVLDPGVELSSVTATSMLGQLNCAITDASSGAALAAQNNNSMIATCTR